MTERKTLAVPSHGVRVVHRFVTIEQIVHKTQPGAADLPILFAEWGLTRSAQEALWVIALDADLGLKTVTEVARGGFHDVMVYPSTVLAAVLAAQTDRFYIAHNHPAGPVRPTEVDVDLTVKIMAAANAAGMSFEDHIIVGPKGWYSFYDEGLLTRAEALGLRAVDSGRPRSPDIQDSPQKARPPGRKRRDDPPSLLFLPGNPSHWFASTARGVRYISLCGVDRQNKRYRPKRGRRVAQCPLCQDAGTSPIPGSLVRRETVSRTQFHASRKVTPARRRLVSSDIARPQPLAGPLRAMAQR